MSAGRFFRASERRGLVLPPLWALGRARPAPPVFPLPDHRGLAGLADWPDAPLPDFIVPEPIIADEDQIETAGMGDQTADNGGGREARAPEGSRRAAPADFMDSANARERHISGPAAVPAAVLAAKPKPEPRTEPRTAPRPASPKPQAARIDLAQASSAMERRALVPVPQRLRSGPEPLLVPPSGQVPCRCGSRSSTGVGMVPDWFGRDCIEGDCPVRGAAHG